MEKTLRVQSEKLGLPIYFLVFLILSAVSSYAKADTAIQCYWKYRDFYSLYDGSFVKRVEFDKNTPSLRLKISDNEVVELERYFVCENGPSENWFGGLWGWTASITPSLIKLSCEQEESGSDDRTTISIDRFSGAMRIETFGFSPNNPDVSYRFKLFEGAGNCELASKKF